MATASPSAGELIVARAPLIPILPDDRSDGGLTVGELCDAYLFSKQTKVDCGELVRWVYLSYAKTCERIKKQFGEATPVDSLRPLDFTRFREVLARGRGVHSFGTQIQTTRSVFKFGYDSDLLVRPMKFGQDFSKPPRRLYRRSKHAGGSMMFEAAEIRALLDKASCQLQAMVLLGINCGFGNSDCAMLPLSAIDLDNGWVSFPRPKTEVDRRCPLWPETIAAIREAIARRRTPTDDDSEGLVFLNIRGRRIDRAAVISAMQRLMPKVGITRRRQGFYNLRRSFRTIADEAGDGVAASYIMGHVPDSDDMASVYRQRISDERLLDVVAYVRQWLFPEDATAQFRQYRDAAEKIWQAWQNLDRLTAAQVQSAITMLSMSQLDLARAIGQSQSHINSLMYGRRPITDETEARLRHCIRQLAHGKAPQPLAKNDLRPMFDSPADVPLSDRAISALSQHPFTAAHLRVLVDCLNADFRSPKFDE